MVPDILAACVIIAVNLWVSPYIGVEGMLACTCAVYLALLGYRILDTRHYLQIHAGGDIALLSVVIAAAGTVYHCFTGTMTDMAAIAAIVLVLACCGGRSMARIYTSICKHDAGHNSGL